MRRHPSSFGAILLAVSLLACGPVSAAATEAKVLQVGVDVEARERVQTDAVGEAHLLFPDGSLLSVGPNSDVALDEHVYDPSSETGHITLSATKGVFRVVGAATTKSVTVTVKTPIATINVRGAAVIDVGETVAAALLFGEEMTVEGLDGDLQRATRPGFEVSVTPEGGPGAPAPISQRMLARLALTGGGAVGAPAPADDDVAAAQLASLNSIGLLADIAPAAGEAFPPPALPNPPIDDLVADARQNEATNATAPDCRDDGERACDGGSAGSDSETPDQTDGSPGSNGNAGGGGSNGNAGGPTGAGSVVIIGTFPRDLDVGEFAILRPVLLVATPGAPRTTRTLNGFASALEGRYHRAQRVDAQGLASSEDPADVTIATSAEEDRVSALFKLRASLDGTMVDVAFETQPPHNDGFFDYYDDLAFLARTDGSVTVDGVAGAEGSLYLLATPNLREHAVLPAGVSFCDCDYLAWGVFDGRREHEGGDRSIELGTWVAGELADFQSQLAGYAQPVTASYSGHVIAGVNNGGAVYGAIGGVNLQFTFGAGSFTLDEVAIVNFDGANLQRTTPATRSFGANGYGTLGNFTIAGVHPTAGPITAEIAGAFFGPGAPPFNTGGKVTFSGANYQGHGTYAAARPIP